MIGLDKKWFYAFVLVLIAITCTVNTVSVEVIVSFNFFFNMDNLFVILVVCHMSGSKIIILCNQQVFYYKIGQFFFFGAPCMCSF